MGDLSTRGNILKAGREVFYKHGLRHATIAKIAAESGVTDSAIYHHFQNKEDLLFSIIGAHLEYVLQQLEEQLAGIVEPISQLSKMIWFHLYYNITHQDYSRLLLFECRSNRNFYQHQTYNSIRKYAALMSNILKQGVIQGVFREDVNMSIVRDLILGALDLETIPYLLGQKTDLSGLSAQPLMECIRPMIQREAPDPAPEKTDKYVRILKAAEKVFAQRSYADASIADIARLAGVAEGTVYENFENKEDLLLTIPKIRFQEHKDILQETFAMKTPLRKFRHFLRYHFLIFMHRPDFLKVYLLNIRLKPKFYESAAYDVFQSYTEIIDQILEEGKNDGSIKAERNCEVVKQLFFGGFAHMALRWVILDRDNRPQKMAEIDELVSLLTRAVFG